MFGSDGNKGCCMAAGLYLMIINPGAKKFSAFLQPASVSQANI